MEMSDMIIDDFLKDLEKSNMNINIDHLMNNFIIRNLGEADLNMINNDILKNLEKSNMNTNIDHPMNNFIIRSLGEADLKVTNISEYDIELYYENEHFDEFCGTLRELHAYLDTIFRYSEGRRWVTVHEIDGVFIFLRIDTYLCWIQAENSFDAVYRYHKLFKKMCRNS